MSWEIIICESDFNHQTTNLPLLKNTLLWAICLYVFTRRFCEKPAYKRREGAGRLNVHSDGERVLQRNFEGAKKAPPFHTEPEAILLRQQIEIPPWLKL